MKNRANANNHTNRSTPTSKRTQHLAILNEISKEISSLTSLPALMEKVYLQASNVLSADFFFIGLYDKVRNEISFPLMYDNGTRWEQEPQPISEETFSGKIILTKKPLLVTGWSDSVQEGDAPSIIVGNEEQITQSLMFAPMLSGEEVIGLISVQSYLNNAYNNDDLYLLSGIAHQVAIAVQNTLLLEATRQNARHLSIINEVGRAVSELRSLSDLLEVIYQQVIQNLPVDTFYVSLHQPETNLVEYPILFDDGIRYYPEPDELLKNSYLSRLLSGEAAILINRTENETTQKLDKNEMLGNASKISASIMTAPLKFGEQVIGTLSVQSYTLNAYNENDLDLLVGIGRQVGVAIQNARLLDEINQNTNHLTILNEVGNSVAKLMDLPELLEAVYQQGKKNISLDTFYVSLYHPEIKEISFPLIYDDGKLFKQPSVPLSESTFLTNFLNGTQSILINRSEEELSRGKSNLIALGETNKISASIIAVPLILRNEVIGMISAQSYSLNAYDEKDVTLLKGIANQVAIAIENSRLYTAAQKEIKERQKVEEQLRAAETRYRELVERVPVVIYSADTGQDGRWHYISPQIESLLGYTPDQWLADSKLWFERILPEDREYVVNTESQAVEKAERVEMEYRMITKDGQVIWIHDEGLSTFVSPDTNQTILQGFLMDITASKNAELALKKSEEKYHSLFLTAQRQAQELSLISAVQEVLAREPDLNILIQQVVEEIALSFGYTFVSAYLLEGTKLNLIHQVGYDSNSVIKTIEINKGVSGRVIRTGDAILIKDVRQESDFLRADQDVQSEICVPLFEGDRICGTLNIESAPSYALDENDLRLMKTLSEQINIAIRRARLYTERIESLRREQYINEFAHAISSTLDLPQILEQVAQVSVSLTSAESATISLIAVDGSKVSDVYRVNEEIHASEDIPKGEGLTWQVYEGGRPIIVDDYQSHPDAIPEWSEAGLRAFMGIPISAGDKRLGVLSIYNRTPGKVFTQRDLSLIEAMARETAIAIQNARLFDALQLELSEHKITQERLLESVQELESKNAELENFTYTVSHDLKSPIVTISGFLGFLESDIQKGDYDKVPKTISRIREATKKMEQLLNELLELSRIGRLVNPPKEIPFGRLVDETLEIVDGQLREKQVIVNVEADFPVVHVDQIRVVEAIQNLVTNAIKFMGEQEKPTINIGMKTINAEKVFFVKDNGMGIAPEHHERIFGLFNKLDPYSDGTGIGLALVKRIIEVHGGKIWVESELGKGTTFYFTLKEINSEETA